MVGKVVKRIPMLAYTMTNLVTWPVLIREQMYMYIECVVASYMSVG